MTNQRKAFQHLPGEENPQFLQDGLRIYEEMKKKYPKQSNEDLDNILNGMCAALYILMKKNVDKDNHKNFLHLIWQILNKNA